jgi:hypothetical protein
LFRRLKYTPHVFLRTGPIKKSLERPCTGPHKILKRISDRVYTIEVAGTTRNVSIEHLKPAYFLSEELASTNISQKVASEQCDRPSTTLKTYSRKVKFTSGTKGK